MPHPALLELCRVAGFNGAPPSELSATTVLQILDACRADIDDDGNLWFVPPGPMDTVALEHGRLLRDLIGPPHALDQTPGRLS